MSSELPHLPPARKSRGRPQPYRIEDNLEKLGLLRQDAEEKSVLPRSRPSSKGKGKVKAVGFKTPPESVRAPSEFRASSRLSQISEGHSNNPSSRRSSRGKMAGILDIDRSNSRKDRTFIGSECAVCEEPLEFTLRGERILQLTCAHVAHEACFYEYIRDFESHYCPTCHQPLGLDSSRGGNVLDLEKLSKMAKVDQRDAQPDDAQNFERSSAVSPIPWEQRQTSQRPSMDDQRTVEQLPVRDTPSRLSHAPSTASRQRNPTGPSQIGSLHVRSDSAASHVSHVSHRMMSPPPAVQPIDYPEPAMSAQPPPRKNDFDMQTIDGALISPPALPKNPIQAPVVSVRSEFPTLTRSRQQQSLTCLITIEVPEPKWRPSVVSLEEAQSKARSIGRQGSVRSPIGHRRKPSNLENQQRLDEITEELHSRVENWHGLDFARFGKLKLHGHIRVGKDRKTWQDLDCYLFTEMLICVKARKQSTNASFDGPSKVRSTLKGSILIKKHLKEVEMFADDLVLTLSLSVAELPAFHLQFQGRTQLEIWRRALLDITNPVSAKAPMSPMDEEYASDNEEYRDNTDAQRYSAANSSFGAGKSYNTAMTDYSIFDPRFSRGIHAPLDIVVVIPVSSSMQGLKISLLRDTLKFLVHNLGEKDRMGLVTFGSSGGGVPVVSMTSKSWKEWPKVIDAIRPVGQKSLRADVVEGANVAMDLLMQRKNANPLSSILLISDSSTGDSEGVDFVVQRAEAAKVSVHSFGLGLTHKPDTIIELSTRTKASYTYVKDWMMLRECVAGVVGSLQTTSHQNVKLKLRLPEGSPAKFVKISGALQITKRASGRDAEATLGDLRFGDKRDILVQLAIAPDSASTEQLPQDPWETIVSGLEALGGSLDEQNERTQSIEELPLIQADLVYGEVMRDGATAQLPRPSLLAITMLPATGRKTITRPMSPLIPPHPTIVLRRMELLTSDMLTRALTLVSRSQHERAHHLLRETRSILKGLGKGSLPPLPPGPPSSALPPTRSPVPSAQLSSTNGKEPASGADGSPSSSLSNDKEIAAAAAAISSPTTDRKLPESPPLSGLPALPPNADDRLPPSTPSTVMPNTPGPHGSKYGNSVDSRIMAALDAELETALEWINHPAVFTRDSRKSVLQAIGVISSQRGYTFRTLSETLWAERVEGVRRLGERSREWRATGGDDAGIMEENGGVEE